MKLVISKSFSINTWNKYKRPSKRSLDYFYATGWIGVDKGFQGIFKIVNVVNIVLLEPNYTDIAWTPLFRGTKIPELGEF